MGSRKMGMKDFNIDDLKDPETNIKWDVGI